MFGDAQTPSQIFKHRGDALAMIDRILDGLELHPGEFYKVREAGNGFVIAYYCDGEFVGNV